jgi:hypothetical protein
LPNIIKVLKSRKVRWVGYVAHMEGMRNAYKILQDMKGRSCLGELAIDGRILEWILGKLGGKV